MLNKFIPSIILLFSFINAECYELNQADCLYWNTYCEWNDETGQCQDIGGDDSSTNSGPFEFSSFNESDGLISSESYLGATVFHPINAEPPYASIVIVPGAFSSETTLHQWAQYYASFGFIAIWPFFK